MTDWKAVARARGLQIPHADLERLTAPLPALESHWREIVRDLPFETETATIMICPPPKVER